MVLHAGADAAGEGVEGIAELLPAPHAQRDEVAHHAVSGILAGEDVIIERALVIVGQFLIRSQAEEMAGEFEHVVGVAALAGVVAEAVVEPVRFAAVFIIAVAADDVGVVPDHGLPEKTGDGEVRKAAGQLVAADGSDRLGHVGVGVLAGHGVDPLCQFAQDELVVEPVRQIEIFLLSGDGVEVGQHLVHAAVFTIEHRQTLLFAEGIDHGGRPVGQAAHHLEREGIPGIGMGIDQPRHHLVDGVPGRPAPVEVEAGGLDLAPGDAGEEGVFTGYGADIAGFSRPLAAGEFGDNVIDPPLEFRVAGARIMHGAGGEIVAESVAGEPLALPAAVNLTLDRQAGVGMEAVEQPVGLDGEQPGNIALHGVFEGAGRDTDLPEIKGAGLDGGLEAGLERAPELTWILGVQRAGKDQSCRDEKGVRFHGLSLGGFTAIRGLMKGPRRLPSGVAASSAGCCVRKKPVPPRSRRRARKSSCNSPPI